MPPRQRNRQGEPLGKLGHHQIVGYFDLYSSVRCLSCEMKEEEQKGVRLSSSKPTTSGGRKERHMKSVAKYALVISSALFCGAFLFSATFVLIDVGCRYLVKPENVSPGDGVLVIGGGFLLGSTVGIAGAAFMLYRFWPRRNSK